MPNYQGVWSLSTQYQNASGWPAPLFGAAAVIMGGYQNGFTETDLITRVSIESLSGETDFGTLLASAYRTTGTFGSTVRAFVAGGRNSGGLLNTIQFVTFASGGNATDFGDRTVDAQNVLSINSDTRGVMAYSSYGGSNLLDYITMASAGNAIDFGDLVTGGDAIGNACSPTRGLFSYYTTSYSATTIDYITTASTGNASTFGNLTSVNTSSSGFSSNTRGIVVAGGVNPFASNAASVDIEYVTTASTGNATDFGDLTTGGWWPAATSNKVRGVIFGGRDLNSSTQFDTMDQVTIATTGNATDFGDLSRTLTTAGAAGDANGGLS